MYGVWFGIGGARWLRLERHIIRGSAATGCSTDRSVDSALSRRITRRRMIQDGPGSLPDGSLVYRFGGWFEVGPACCPTASSRRFGRWFEAGPASCPTSRSRHFGGWFGRDGPGCLAWRLARIGPVRRIVRRIRCLPNGSRDNCLTGKIRFGIRSHTHQRRWAWAQAQSYPSWSVLTISRLMPAPRISLNEVITCPSEVEGLSGSTAWPFYLSA